MAKFLLTTIIFVLCIVYCYSQKTYFISSSSGSKNNTGLSEDKPLNNISFLKAGCRYLFKRGDVFYTRILKVPNVGLEDPITISCYGKGSLPVISTYKIIKANAWTLKSRNVWVAKINDLSMLDGFKDTSDCNVGFIKVGKKIYGDKVQSEQMLNSDWSFHSNNGNLFIYLKSNPGSLGVIKIACKYNIIDLSNNLRIENISINGSGGHGLKGDNINNVIIKGLIISEIGGSYLYKSKSLRYGNGIELWGAAKNCKITFCKISQVYDAALTMQGESDSLFFNNIIFKNNYTFNNEQSFEFWIRGYRSGFIGCKFINNRCSNAGYGWSHNVRRDKNAAVHILNYHWEVASSDLLISNNTFARAKSGYIYVNYTKSKLFTGFQNRISLNSQLPIISRDKRFKIKDAIKFERIIGIEQQSTYKIIK